MFGTEAGVAQRAGRAGATARALRRSRLVAAARAACLAVAALLAGPTALAQTQATCEAWLATDPSPAGIPGVSGPGVTQRANFLAAGGKLVALGSRYYAVAIPAAFYTAALPVVVLDLHGTGGYPEAEWNDWHTTMAANGHAFISLAWGAGSGTVDTDEQVYANLKQILQDVGAQCPLSGARRALMGFSVGSALSFALMIRDTADAKLFARHVAMSGAAWSPLITGMSVLHPLVESSRSNATAVQGTKSWLYCGDVDFDHVWSMCDEMPLGRDFLNDHGGSATLWEDPAGTHHSLPTTPTGYNLMYAFLVSKDAQSIAFGAAPSVTAGHTGTVSATATSGLAVTFSSLTPSTCTVSGATVTGVAAGTCTVAADQAGNAAWDAAPQVTQGITVAADPAADTDNDGIPDTVEAAEGRNPLVKDNDVFTSARLFAMQQYRDFLGREGDAAGITGWTTALTSGGYTRPRVIDAFLSSTEFAGYVSPVVRLYFAAFLRVPDYAGLTYNAALVRAGTLSITAMADYFAASPEFVARYGTLDNRQYVTLLYGNVLGRVPDVAGLDGWVALLEGGMSRGQVLLGFSDSPEYQGATANEVLVTMMYAGMLRRTPDTAGYNGWVAALDAGTSTRQQVINGFLMSPEYRARFLP